MKNTIFNFIANLKESQFVNITGDTQEDALPKLQKLIKDFRFDGLNYVDSLNWECLTHHFRKDNTKPIQLEPLAEKPLSSQLYWLTGHHYTADRFRSTEGGVRSLGGGNTFLYASQAEEEAYKLEEKQRKEREDLDKRHKYDNHPTPIIDLNNAVRWGEGLKLAQEGQTVEMCEGAYWHFLECVSPKRMEGTAFLTGEPHHHNEKGQAVYLGGIKKGEKYFAKYGTAEEFDNKTLFKNLPA